MNTLEFDISEYERRLGKAQRLMAERGIDALLIATYSNFRYFTGHTTHRWMQVTAPTFAIVPKKGRPVALIPGIEAGRISTNPWLAEFRTVKGYVNIGVPEVATALRDFQLDRGTIGCESGPGFRLGIPVGDFIEIQKSLPHANFVDAKEVFWGLRVPKSEPELEYLGRACQLTDRALQDLYRTAKPGMTEKQLFQGMVASVMTAGAEWPGSIPVGSRSPGEAQPADSHLRLQTDRKIKEGDLVWLDAGCIYNGYWSDFMRMFCLGKAQAKWKSAYRFIYECTHAAIEEAKPGAPVSNAMARFQKMVRASPFSELADGLKVKRIAHGVGLDLIEPPSLSFDDKTILEPGTVLTIEPSIYTPDVGFFMIEEDVVVTESGPKILSDPAPPELREIG